MIPGEPEPPFSFAFIANQKTLDVEVPIELKDVPIRGEPETDDATDDQDAIDATGPAN